MEDGLVGLRSQCAQDARFGAARILQDRERLAGMRGHQHRIEGLCRMPAVARPGGHPNLAAGTVHAGDRAVQAQCAATLVQALHNRVDVLSGAAGDGVPLRPVKDLQQSVVIAEARETHGRESQHRFNRAGPDRSGHRQQVIVAQGLPVAAVAQQITERHRTRLCVGRARECGRFAVKAQHIAQHPPEPGSQQIAGLREQGAQIILAAPLQIMRTDRHREAHVRERRFDLQVIEKCEQSGVGSVVEDEKPHIDRMGDAVQADIDAVGMTAGDCGGLEEHHVTSGR